MNTLKATYKIVTPMFIAGADSAKPTTKAELRAPSFKGALRFWFRAIALSVSRDVKEVKKMEKELFGSTDKKYGQAKFLLDIHPADENNKVKTGERWDGHGSAYLGYRLIKYGNHMTNDRSYIKQGCSFAVTLLLKPDEKSENNCKYLKWALIALGLFGGLGSRSRKGFGSINLEKLQYNDQTLWVAPKNAVELKEKIDTLFDEIGDMFEGIPGYSAFSKKSTISIYTPPDGNSNALSLLDDVGKEMLRYRSYGRKNRENGRHELPWREKAEQIFADDHDLILDVSKKKIPQGHPRRVVFGLPHNYYFSDGTKINVNSAENNRRASPLFIHIQELSGRSACVFTILPADFLPEQDMIKIDNSYPVKVDVDYSVLTDFVKRFPGIMEVLPK